MATRLLIAAWICCLLSRASTSLAYDTESHRFLGQAAARSSTLDSVLRDHLDVLEGRTATLRSGRLALPIEDWVGGGAFEEDVPAKRVFNHFHNPLRAWREAGLTLVGPIGDSSVLWSQRTSQQPGGTWTWAVARRAFLDALTLQSPDEREQRFAETFSALGHLTHLIQDASVPAHVRNDAHPSLPLFGAFIPLNPDWYEDWVEATRTTRRDVFIEFVGLPPVRPLSLVLRSIDPAAPVAIAGLIDTEQVTTDGPVPSILGPANTGIAEFTNMNFLSRDTIFGGGFSRPSVDDLGAGFLELERGAFRLYFPKVVPGTTVVEVPHFLAEGVLARHLSQVSTTIPAAGVWHMPSLVLQDYARELIPRAIGYSAELIDYFFRGRLDVDVSLDPVDPTLVQLTGTNGSPDALVDGRLTLYADTAAGQRVEAPGVDPTSVLDIPSGGPLTPVRFQPPADAERFVAVYQGALGLERPAEHSPGAVIGKVVGGLRVEEVFAQGDRWRLRTPRGVFDLPLSTATYDEVKWGDGDHVLVARTALDADLPFVATFEITRQPNSIEPVVSGTPPVAELRPVSSASLAFASAPLVTTLTFEQTTAYRQQIGRWRQVLATQWVQGTANFYTNVSLTRTPIAFETIHTQEVVFAATIPVRLDAAHNLDLGALHDPYHWRLVDVGADRDGRLLGLAVISLTEPPVAPVSVPWFGLDTAGRPVAATTVSLRARFPANMTTIWTLVDLGAGEVIASTAEPVVRVVSRHAAEGPPWDSAGASWPEFHGIYRHGVTTYSGGPLDGRIDESVVPTSLARRTSAAGIDARIDAHTFDQALTVAGWFQPELATALARSGLGSFDVGATASSMVRWSYACVAQLCTSDDGDWAGLEIDLRRGGVLAPPAELRDARRARPAPAGERLALLGAAYRETFLPVGSVVVWDVARSAAREALAVPAGFHELGEQASTGVVLLSYSSLVDTGGTFLVPLDEGGVATFFVGEDLAVAFTPLAVDRLYSVRDLRFYRGGPPLQATPLPARLSPLSPNPVGDYHAIRVP